MMWWLVLALAAEPTPVDDGTAGMDAYLAERLDVIERPVSTVYGKGYDGSGRFWFVTQGGRSLSAVRFAEAVGDDARARTHRRRGTATTATGLGALVVGTAAALFGVVATGAAGQQPSSGEYALLGASYGVGALGLVGGPLILSRKVRMVHPSVLYTEDEARTRAQEHNAALRAQHLGVE